MGCWAAVLGDCAGKMNREHIISKNLLGKSVTFRGFFPKCEDFKTVGKNSFVSKCLCERHNGLLSPCDNAAKEFREALEWLSAGCPIQTGEAKVKIVNGFRLAKWLAKTVCNIAAVSEKHVPLPLIRYAFAGFDHPWVHVYFLPHVGDTLEIARNPQEFHWLRDTANPDRVAVVCYVLGIPFLLSTFDLKGVENEICERLQIQTTRPREAFTDRMGAIKIGDDSDKWRGIWFDWGAVRGDLQVDVDLFAMCQGAMQHNGSVSLLGTFDCVLGDEEPVTKERCSVAVLLRFGRSEIGTHEVHLSFEDSAGERRDYSYDKIDVQFQAHDDMPSLTYPLILNIREMTFPEFGDYTLALFVDGVRKASRPIVVRIKTPTGSQCSS